MEERRAIVNSPEIDPRLAQFQDVGRVRRRIDQLTSYFFGQLNSAPPIRGYDMQDISSEFARQVVAVIRKAHPSKNGSDGAKRSDREVYQRWIAARAVRDIGAGLDQIGDGAARTLFRRLSRRGTGGARMEGKSNKMEAAEHAATLILLGGILSGGRAVSKEMLMQVDGLTQRVMQLALSKQNDALHEVLGAYIARGFEPPFHSPAVA